MGSPSISQGVGSRDGPMCGTHTPLRGNLLGSLWWIPPSHRVWALVEDLCVEPIPPMRGWRSLYLIDLIISHLIREGYSTKNT